MDPNAQPGRDCIECDGPTCRERNPTKRCSRCRTTYYCSSDCAVAHWRVEHKNYCRSVESIQKTQIGGDASSQESEFLTKLDGNEINAACPICLDEEIKNPIVLKKCRHAFCFSCLYQHEKHMKRPEISVDGVPSSGPKPVRCPCCRAEVDGDIRRSTVDKLILYITKATQLHEKMMVSASENKEKLEEEFKFQCEAAAQMLSDFTSESSDGQDIIQANILRISLATLQEDFQAALNASDEVIDIMEKCYKRHQEVCRLMAEGERLQSLPGDHNEEITQNLQQLEALTSRGENFATREQLVSARLEKAKVYKLMENWDHAMESYRKLLEDFPEQADMTAIAHREIFASMAECLYHKGEYEMAIGTGEAAIEMNRHYDGCHKYVALSHKANGNIEKAREVMAQAVLYETPWDVENIEKARQLWLELMNTEGEERETDKMWIDEMLKLLSGEEEEEEEEGSFKCDNFTRKKKLRYTTYVDIGNEGMNLSLLF